MTRLALNSTFIRRGAHVTIVALCVASSLALLGAVPADQANLSNSPTASAARTRKTVPVAALPDESGALLAGHVVQGPQVEPKFELLQADPLPAPVVASTAAAAPAARVTVMRMEVTAYCACVK